MKGFMPNISVAPKTERPFPDKEILWNSEKGGQYSFPTSDEARLRTYSDYPIPLQKFGNAVANAQERIWIVDAYIFTPDNEKPSQRIEQILEWLPICLEASDIRLLTKQSQEIDEIEIKILEQRAQDINAHAARREKECRIEVRRHLTQSDCNFIHDRFAIIDDELWHFGGTVGGFHSKVSAASRGWRASEHGAIRFFEEIWNAGKNK